MAENRIEAGNILMSCSIGHGCQGVDMKRTVFVQSDLLPLRIQSADIHKTARPQHTEFHEIEHGRATGEIHRRIAEWFRFTSFRMKRKRRTGVVGLQI